MCLAVVTSATNEGVSVDVAMNVDTQGQIVLERERTYWETEFDVLTSYLMTGKNKHEDVVGQLGRYNLRHNFYITVALMLAFLLGFMLLKSAGVFSCVC